MYRNIQTCHVWQKAGRGTVCWMEIVRPEQADVRLSVTLVQQRKKLAPQTSKYDR